jgi:hypothetical protein
MVFEHWAFRWSDRCYQILLSLYPVEFRVRFGREIAQVFRDCCRDEAAQGNLAGFLALWIRALADLGFSISRERGRVLLNVRDLHVRTCGLIDSLVILTIIAFHLLAAGTGIAFYLPQTYETAGGFFVVAVTAGAALGGLGVTCSMVLAHYRQIHYRLINL